MPAKRRVLKGRWPPLGDFAGYFDLTIGPGYETDPDSLRAAWEWYRAEVMADNAFNRVGRRPWAYWYFDVNPGDLPKRLRNLRKLKTTPDLEAEAILRLRLCSDVERLALEARRAERRRPTFPQKPRALKAK